MRAEKSRLTPPTLLQAANSFASQAAAAITSSGAKTVLLYASLPDEVPTLDFLERCNCRCVLPCVVDDEHLELRLYTGPLDLEVRGKYHIPEPVGPLFTDYAAIDLALIPGMAFDTCGHRLGRGKGYYDRLLALAPFENIPKVGVCFDFQLVAEVPSMPHDSTMDSLLVVPTTTPTAP